MFKSETRQYFFGIIFLGFGIYQLVTGDYLEFGLYAMAGLAFIFNTLTFEPRLVTYKKALVITTWILIGITGLLFLYMLQFKYF
jgi:hypothetical protein